MHQTTIRFGSDLWESLAVAASSEGVSVAQYVRESAVERLVRAGGADGGLPVAATDRRRDARAPRQGPQVPREPVRAEPVRSPARTPGTERPAALLARVADGERAASRNTESSAAVWAQSRLARARARELRAASRALTAERRAARTSGGAAGAPRAGDAVPRVGGARA